MTTSTKEAEPKVEAAKDPGAFQPCHPYYGEKDFEGHRAHSMYVGVPVRNRRNHHRRHGRGHRRKTNEKEGDKEDDKPGTPPSQRVHFILGEDDDDGSVHPIFSEMIELYTHDDGDMEWRETARWVKFEEDVEEGGNRWSKPHVATLSLHSLFELRRFLMYGAVHLTMEAQTMESICDLVIEHWGNNNMVSFEHRDKVKELLLLRHRHQHERRRDREGTSSANMARLPIIRSLAEIGRSYSTNKNEPSTPQSPGVGTGGKPLFLSPPGQPGVVVPSPVPERKTSDSDGALLEGVQKHQETLEPVMSHSGLSHNGSMTDAESHAKQNLQFMKKLPPNVEVCNILVAELDFLEQPMAAFIRLNSTYFLGDLSEIPAPTKFIFILLGPIIDGTNSSAALTSPTMSRFHEIGRAMGVLMSDEVFHEIAYKAKNRAHLLAGVDEFLDAVTVLPPGEWDPSIRIEPPGKTQSQEHRKHPEQATKIEVEVVDGEEKLREEMGLVRTGKLFGGLMNDVKRKTPFYASDFKDALSIQCIASYIFLYFACLTPIITFGGLLAEATENRMAAMESLVSGFVVGVAYALFSGQPLTILGSTGPVLVFETILYDFCKSQEMEYLTVRLWIGMWIGLILLVMVAFDTSYIVCYITRFTEESFATLIAFIFIYKAIEKLIKIGQHYPIDTNTELLEWDCSCAMNGTTGNVTYSPIPKEDCLGLNGTMVGEHCGQHPYAPDVFLMSILLFLGTFFISVFLKNFRNSPYFPNSIRVTISDFAVIIAIVSMTGADFAVGLKTPKLHVPREFKPTWSGRGWIIDPLDCPWWIIPLSVIPAILGTILIFMDQQITAVIVNRKENKLKKGCGYHLDLLVLACLIIINSLMGIPWFVAATVLSINHVNSLKLESEVAAPGEKPQFLGVREQRVTHLLIFVTIGLSVFLTSMLSFIPMPVLFGVFLYMGVSSLKGLQFFDRLLIMFMPAKYQPDYTFLRKVPLRRIHCFTLIQLTCLAVLWLIKSFKQTSIFFPLMLVIIVGIRKALDFIFTSNELKVLDDLLPEFTRRKVEEAEELKKEIDVEPGRPEEQRKGLPVGPSGNLSIPLANGNIMRIPMNALNISEELSKTDMWRKIEKDDEKAVQINGKNRAANEAGTALEKQRLSQLPEEDEDDVGITITVNPPSSKDLRNQGDTSV